MIRDYKISKPRCLARRKGKFIDLTVTEYFDIPGSTGTVWTNLSDAELGWKYNLPLHAKPKDLACELELIAKKLRTLGIVYW
jgi:hypothetical protein